MRSVNNSLETVNAAATAIVNAEGRVQQSTVQISEMAEAAVTFVVEKLAGVLKEEANFLYGVGDEVEWIERELRRMLCCLKDADTKQMRDERVGNWVREIRDVAHEAEDVVDTVVARSISRDVAHKAEDVVDTFGARRVFRAPRRRRGFVNFSMRYPFFGARRVFRALKRRRGLVNFSKRYLFFFSDLIFRYKVGMEIKQIKNKICEISESRSNYGINELEGTISYANERLQERRRTSPRLNESYVIGIEEEAEELVERLLNPHPRCCVVSIVGMGGLGKTTLAKEVYNRDEVKWHFECHAWTCVSQQYKIRDLLQDIAKHAMGMSKDELESMNKDDLEEKLYPFLKGKRYLIVLDDIWDTQAWDDLKTCLPDEMNGSRVLLTTRIKAVALYTDPMNPPLMLRLLTDNESWGLLFKKVFSTENDETSCPQELVEVGKQIAARCNGLPLAIVVMGGLLSTKEKSESAWLNVLRTIYWQLNHGQDQCSEILALSYKDLPLYLKLCFLYLGIFPEDFEISVKQLIHLWVAEGFIQVRGEETLEEAAHDCLEELICRSMVQLVRRTSTSGRAKKCSIHDLLRNLSISKGKEDSFLDIYGTVDFESPTRARRLAVHHSINRYISLHHSTPHLRSLLCFRKGCEEKFDREQWEYICKGLKLISVLNLERVKVPDQLDGLEKLIHLKYLKLFGANICLPLNMSSLHKLQTLDLRHWHPWPHVSIKVPNFIWEMKQLRHLYMNRGIRIEPPKRANDVSSVKLQTLGFINGQDLKLDFLAKLTGLRKLKIDGDMPTDDEEALCCCIVVLESLQSLWCWNIESSFGTEKMMIISRCMHLRKLFLKGRIDKLLDNGEFPPQLTNLSLQRSKLKQNPMAVLEKLLNLRFLRLYESYEGREMVCSTGGFPRLEWLELVWERNMVQWRVEEGAMPSLRRLEIFKCEQLEMLPDGLKSLSNLVELSIVSMPNEFNKRLRQDEGADWDKIKHIPSLTIS